eukprot:1159541-Pelagomonas_calceolata.AAC.6
MNRAPWRNKIIWSACSDGRLDDADMHSRTGVSGARSMQTCPAFRGGLCLPSSMPFAEGHPPALVSPHFLLCGDYNAKICGLNEVSDAHGGLLTGYPAPLNAQKCKCASTNTAGRLLIDFASAAECFIATGRKVASSPDHVLVSSRVYQAAKSAHTLPVQRISDHCVQSVNSGVENAISKGTDWNFQTPHVCRGGCVSKMVLKWNPEFAKDYAEVLTSNKEIQEQLVVSDVKLNLIRLVMDLSTWDPNQVAELSKDQQLFSTPGMHFIFMRLLGGVSTGCEAVESGRRIVWASRSMAGNPHFSSRPLRADPHAYAQQLHLVCKLYLLPDGHGGLLDDCCLIQVALLSAFQ